MYKEIKSCQFLGMIMMAIICLPLSSCAKTVTPKLEPLPELKFSITMAASVDHTKFGTFILIADPDQQSGVTSTLFAFDNNFDVNTHYVVIPGQNVGDEDASKVTGSTDSTQAEAIALASSHYFSKWSDIIYFDELGAPTLCSGPFQAFDTFDEFETQCDLKKRTNIFENITSTGTQLRFEIRMDYLAAYAKNKDRLYFGFLTLDKIVDVENRETGQISIVNTVHMLQSLAYLDATDKVHPVSQNNDQIDNPTLLYDQNTIERNKAKITYWKVERIL